MVICCALAVVFLSLSSLCAVIELAGIVWVASIVCGGVGCVTWHAGNMKGACGFVDTGDMAMWFSHSFVWQLSWFVGGQHCLSWWWLFVSNMVVGHSWCSWGGGCGVKKEVVSQFVMHVIFGSMFYGG